MTDTPDTEEIEQLVTDLRDDGHMPSEIGMELRDEHGVPDVKEATGKSVTDILDENEEGLDVPEDLYNLIIKAARLREHLEENPKDASAIQGLQGTEDKIRSLADYHKRNGSLDEDWAYEPEEANLYLE